MTPARMIAIRLMASWAAAPRNSVQSWYAAATPTLAAAGIVVTEISTPIRAPDLAVESESTPATPASRATMTENGSGCEMNSVAGWSPSSSGPRSAARRSKVLYVGGHDRGWKTDRKGDERSTCRRQASLDECDAESCQWAELSSDDHRADDQDDGVGEDSHAGYRRCEHHEGEEARTRVRRSQRFGFRPLPRPPRRQVNRPPPARRPVRRRRWALSIVSREIVPARSTPRWRSSATTRLASSRATSQRMRSPSGLRATRGRCTTLRTDGLEHSRSSTCFCEFRGRDDSQVNHQWLGRIMCR